MTHYTAHEGLQDQIAFEVASAKTYPANGGYDLVDYSASTMICTPASLPQEVGAALGAQAGEERIRSVVTAAGFTRFRRAAETPFNLVFEARP